MSRATSSLPRSAAAHAILILYTIIALFPVIVVVMNSFKARNAIFRAPLMPPTTTTFDPVVPAMIHAMRGSWATRRTS